MAESGDSATKSGTRVRVGYPYNELHNHGVSGVPDPLLDEWTADPVPDPKLKALRKVARARSVPLEESSRDLEELNS